MLDLVLKFVSCSRVAGLRISTAEVLDCITQLELIDVMDETQFAAVLRANFAKSRREQAKFDHLYHLFFHELRQDAGIAHSGTLADQKAEILNALKMQVNGSQTAHAIIDLLGDDPSSFLEALRQIQSPGEGQSAGMGANLGSVTQRLEMLLGLRNIKGALSQFLNENRSRIPWEDRRDLMSHFDDRLETARRLLMENPRPGYELSKPIKSYDRHLKELGKISFASLTPREVAEVRELIEQLVRKFKDTVSRRYARANSGVLDVKKTLRGSAKYQGIPMEIFFRSRPPRKGKIVTLCDLSGSVWSAARFMLNILYSLQECFTQVRSFVFVAGLDEVTQVFESFEINHAIDKVLSEADIDYHAATDYGQTFREFKKDYMDILNKKTTFIIIGDGRTNYTNPEEGLLEEMRDRCRRIIWLNPETELFWHSGDSEMRLYQTYCHEVRPCQNLNQLIDFIKDLVL
ncbi:MAG: VWA domain-containing protein [Deltaproteobacteria bacterium]|nr:MAG: VWA domain-containing protein [Deltaproteobacteria bacterium]